MAKTYSTGRQPQVDFPGLLVGETDEEIQYYIDDADLTGMVATDTLEFKEGIPNGSRILKDLSYMTFEDCGTGGTLSMGDAASATRFCSAVNSDSAAGQARFTEDTDTPEYLVDVDNWKPLLTRNTASVTGSPKVVVVIAYLPPRQS